MNLPFTPEEFLNVFRVYNQSIWPAQILAYLLGLLAIYAAFKKTPSGSRIIVGILSLFWLWNGGAYHLGHFSSINKMAYLFGMLFLFQGVIFFYFGIIRKTLVFRFRSDKYSLAGALLILYAMVVYPVLGYNFGHAYPTSPVFGVAPCPTTIFTFGIMLWTASRVPKAVMIIPLLWSVIGFTAAITLGIYEDIGLLIAGVVCILLIWIRDRKG